MNSVIVFGDSITKGVVFDALKNKYQLLRDCFINLVSGKESLQVSNYSRFGCTVSQGMRILRRHSGELPGSDFTLLEFGGNDCDYVWQEISEDPQKKHLCKTPVDMFPVIYAEMIETVRAEQGLPVLLTLPPIDEHRYFDWVSRGLNGNNILHFLGGVRTIFTWQERYSDIVKDLSATLCVPLIDIRTAFLEADDYRDLLCNDGIHPNAAGHVLISKVLQHAIDRRRQTV